MGKKFTESKAFNIILAVLIALALWVYVTAIIGQVGSMTIRNVPITLVGEDVLNSKGLMIDASTKLTVNVGITGGRSALVAIASNSSEFITARLDVSEISEAGEYELPCKLGLENTLTSGVRLDGDSTQTIRVVVTKMLSKTIEVRGNFTGTVKDGYRTNTVEITPSTVRIQGPEALVNQIDYAQVTITGEELTKTVSGEMSFDMISSDGEVLKSDEISSNVNTVSVVLPVVKTLEIPLTVDFIYGGGITEENFARYVEPYVDIQPNTIQISGEESDITPLEGKSITLGKIDLADVVQENQTYTSPIVLASELSNDSGISEATVTISVKGLETKTVETSNIEVINVPEGFTASAVTQSLQVQVRGPADALETVDGYQLRVVVDLEGETLRQAQFPFQPKIYLDGESTCGVVNGANGYIVVVNIQSQ